MKFAIEKGYFTCLNSVFKLPLPTIEKLTYLALTRYADSNNRAWPMYETLARDVSCGRKRVIQAVTRLVQCSLVAKQPRGNRTNIYLVYPPEYHCEKIAQMENKAVFESVERTPQKEPEVASEHPEDSPETPSGCRENTLRVSPEHPISTKTSTKDKSSSTKPTKGKTRDPDRKEINPNDVEAVQRSFKNKGFRVNDAVIIDYLGKYDLAAIKGAIFCTDFAAARNPLAVISSNLARGNYVMPTAREAPEAAPPLEPPLRNPGEEEAILELRKQAREGLLNKTKQPAQA